MKQAKIFYHYDDGIIIDGFKNVLTLADLPLDYLSGCPCFAWEYYERAVWIKSEDKEWEIRKGDKLSVSEWKKIKNVLKKAGKRLSEIRRNVKTEEFKDEGVIIKHYSRGKKEIITDIIVRRRKVDLKKKSLALTPYEEIIGRGVAPDVLWVSSPDYFARYVNRALRDITFSKDGTFFHAGSPICTFKIVGDKKEFEEAVRCMKGDKTREFLV